MGLIWGLSFEALLAGFYLLDWQGERSLAIFIWRIGFRRAGFRQFGVASVERCRQFLSERPIAC